MSDGIISALIAASAAVVGVFLTQFVAEKYKRFKEGSAIAAGILGELKSYEAGIPLLRRMMASLDQVGRAGQKHTLPLRPVERPKDLYFDEVVGKLGLLGPDLVEVVVYVYSNLRAFRLALELISMHHAEMGDEEFVARCAACNECLERAVGRREELLAMLKVRSTRRMHWWSD